ncbi:hypothetical protein [Sporosarcina sp. E16_3]|uniref:hypothetical protein n=1 Tax=Sporosarcina sp. E16_3 TaxID=2789293 RepID=UPI001C4A6BE2|nr:hypothetical protein [Sporosarcina sp. E16_3]
MNAVGTVAEMHEPIEREISVMREAEVIFKKQDPFSVLLLGVDEREGDTGRSDTIVAMTDVQKNYRSALGKVEQLNFQGGNGQMMNGVWYYLMDDEELTEVSKALRAHLGL